MTQLHLAIIPCVFPSDAGCRIPPTYMIGNDSYALGSFNLRKALASSLDQVRLKKDACTTQVQSGVEYPPTRYHESTKKGQTLRRIKFAQTSSNPYLIGMQTIVKDLLENGLPSPRRNVACILVFYSYFSTFYSPSKFDELRLDAAMFSRGMAKLSIVFRSPYKSVNMEKWHNGTVLFHLEIPRRHAPGTKAREMHYGPPVH
ncbi:hypothetical protein E4U43_003456, partial [Claviceps pusilla]